MDVRSDDDAARVARQDPSSLGEFKTRGWELCNAVDVKSALDLAARHQPNVIVSATEPPDAAGYHYVRALRAVIEHDVKIVGISSPESPAGAARAGFDFVDENDPAIDFERLHCSIAPRGSDGKQKTTTKMPRLR